MFRSLIVIPILLCLPCSSVAFEREVKFSSSSKSGSASLTYGDYSSTGFYFERGGITLRSFYDSSISERKKRGRVLDAWFEKDESEKRFVIRPHNPWLMKNCSKLVQQTDVQIRGFRATGEEAGYFETNANVSCHDLKVSGYDYNQYLLITLHDVDELFNYFWDYSGVEVDFSLGRLENQDLNFYSMFSAKNFRKNYKDLR